MLLRASEDPKVWRIVQAATLGVDLGILATLWNVLRMRGRSRVGDWEAGEWFKIGFTCVVVVIRGAFLAGVGKGEGVGRRVGYRVARWRQ